MADWKIGTGSAGGGGSFDKEEHEGHLIFAIGVELREGMQTRFGVADAAACTYFGCVDDNVCVEDYLLFGTALVPVLVADAQAGFDVCCGRLVKGRASGSQNPPWLLETPTPEDQELMSKWLDAHATRLRSGKILVELEEAPRTSAPAVTTAPEDEEPF